MILFIECIIACVIFGIGIVGSILANKVFWLQEYPPAVQEKFLSLHPEYKVTDKKESLLGLIVKKMIACLLFVVVYGLCFWGKEFYKRICKLLYYMVCCKLV